MILTWGLWTGLSSEAKTTSWFLVLGANKHNCDCWHQLPRRVTTCKSRLNLCSRSSYCPRVLSVDPFCWNHISVAVSGQSPFVQVPVHLPVSGKFRSFLSCDDSPRPAPVTELLYDSCREVCLPKRFMTRQSERCFERPEWLWLIEEPGIGAEIQKLLLMFLRQPRSSKQSDRATVFEFSIL